jgi:hypothetical protein
MNLLAYDFDFHNNTSQLFIENEMKGEEKKNI